MYYETTRARVQTYQERENRTHAIKTLDILFTTLKPAPSFFLCVETPIFDARRPTTKVDDDDVVAVFFLFFSRGAACSSLRSRGSTPFFFFL